METFSVLLAICAGNSPVPSEFPTQRPVTRSFDVYFDLRPNKRLSKQLWGWWLETQSRPLWRHRNVGACLAPSHHLIQYWLIINCAIRKKKFPENCIRIQPLSFKMLWKCRLKKKAIFMPPCVNSPRWPWRYIRRDMGRGRSGYRCHRWGRTPLDKARNRRHSLNSGSDCNRWIRWDKVQDNKWWVWLWWEIGKDLFTVAWCMKKMLMSMCKQFNI